MSLTDEDRANLQRAASLTAAAWAIVREFEATHGLDLTGPALAALTRADVSYEFIPRELDVAARYMEAS